MLAIRAHNHEHSPDNDNDELQTVHLPSSKDICSEAEGDLAYHGADERCAHHTGLDTLGNGGDLVCIEVSRPVDVTDHGGYDVEGEEAEGVGEESDTCNYDDPDLEGRRVDSLEGPFAAFGDLGSC